MSDRVLGLDLARGLAVLGMVAAHVGHDGEDLGPFTGWSWLWVSHGRPAALFAVLAGVTLAIMTARGAEADGGMRRTRARIAARAAMLIALGLVLEELGVPVVVVLVNLGVTMLVLLPLLRAPAWLLGALAAALVAWGQTLVAWIRPDGLAAEVPVVEALWSLRYPVLAWVGYALVGMLIGRLRLSSARVQASLAGLGVALVVAAAVVGTAVDSPSASLEPHAYSPAEMTQNIGVALAVVGAACWLAPRATSLLSPVIAVGSMALSAYVLHLLVIGVVGPEMVWYPSNVALVALVAVLLAGAWAWRRWLGRGPLERWLTAVANVAGDAATPPTRLTR